MSGATRFPRYSPAQAGGGARRTRRGSTECAARSLDQRARRTRPVFSRLSRIGDQEFVAHLRGLHAGALAPYGHEPVQHVRINRSILDLAVSRPASNASAVRFA